MRHAAPIVAGPDRSLVDRLIELYCAWREECAGVRLAYERLDTSSPDDRGLAFAACIAALDREDAAARSYGAQIRRVGALMALSES